jgi:hypothetical protein
MHLCLLLIASADVDPLRRFRLGLPEKKLPHSVSPPPNREGGYHKHRRTTNCVQEVRVKTASHPCARMRFAAAEKCEMATSSCPSNCVAPLAPSGFKEDD